MKTENDEIIAGQWAVLPAEVRYADIHMGAKVMYAEISALTNRYGHCFAANSYFQRLYGVGERTIQRYLTELEQGGFIQILDGNGGKGRRRIYAGINPLYKNPDKNDGVPENPDKNDGVTPPKLSPPNKEFNNKPNNSPPISPKAEKAPMPAELMKRATDYAGEDAELLARFLDFAENRRAIKKPIKTDRTLTLLLSKLNELSNGNRKRKLQLIDLAIERNWLSFFPLREEHAIRLPRESGPSYEPEVSAWQ